MCKAQTKWKFHPSFSYAMVSSPPLCCAAVYFVLSYFCVYVIKWRQGHRGWFTSLKKDGRMLDRHCDRDESTTPTQTPTTLLVQRHTYKLVDHGRRTKRRERVMEASISQNLLSVIRMVNRVDCIMYMYVFHLNKHNPLLRLVHVSVCLRLCLLSGRGHLLTYIYEWQNWLWKRNII